jgi:hypothetical protein
MMYSAAVIPRMPKASAAFGVDFFQNSPIMKMARTEVALHRRVLLHVPWRAHGGGTRLRTRSLTWTTPG